MTATGDRDPPTVVPTSVSGTAQVRPAGASPRHRRALQRRRRAVAGLLLLATAIGVFALTRGSAPARVPVPRVMSPSPPADPIVYRPANAASFVSRATAGEAHALFSESPGGALVTAERVSRVRALVNAAVAGTGIDPNLLEGLVFVESAGRPDAVAGGDPAGAAGLTQILPDTARSMLGLHVDLTESRRLTQAIAHALLTGASTGTLGHLLRERAAIDQRFDPGHALAGTVRYLQLAATRFGREDLAFVSYHMGMGNLASVLDTYDGGRAVPYAQLFFDSTPDHHPVAFNLLSGFSDQSSLYLWRVLGGATIMHLYRSDRSALARLTRLHVALASQAEVLHPPDRTPAFADPAALAAAYSAGTLEPLPANAAQLGLVYAADIGAPARRLHAPPGLYRGLRPVAVSVLLELVARVRALAHTEAPLMLTSAVTDRRYQRLLGVEDLPAAAGYSFTFARQYASPAQARAVQTELDRLQALNLIAWTAYPSEIEVTAASDAARVLAHGV